VLLSALLSGVVPDILSAVPLISLPAGNIFQDYGTIIVGVTMLYVSQVFITRHLWMPKNIRLELVEK